MGKISMSGEHLAEILQMLMPQQQGYDGVSYDASGPLGPTLTPPLPATPVPPAPGPVDPVAPVDPWHPGGNALVDMSKLEGWGSRPGGSNPGGGDLRGKSAGGYGYYDSMGRYVDPATTGGGGFVGPSHTFSSWNNDTKGWDTIADQHSASYAGHEGQTWNPDTQTWSGPDTRLTNPPPGGTTPPGGSAAPPPVTTTPPGGGGWPTGNWPDKGGNTSPSPGPGPGGANDIPGGTRNLIHPRGGGPPAVTLPDYGGGGPPPDPFNPDVLDAHNNPRTHSGYDGTQFDATTDPTMGTTPTTPIYGTGNDYPTGAQTLGGGTYPWLSRYQGPMTAPMSKEQNWGLDATGNFVGGGMGLGGANDYLNSVLGGKYLDVTHNPYIAGIRTAGQGLKDYQDTQANRRIQSSMAAGGNALSGATAQAEGDYANNSNNQFQQMMNNLYNQQYSAERGYQNQAPGQLNNLAQTQMGGLNSYMNMAAIPQQIAQQNDTAQYQDWLRQIGAMNNQSKYSDQLAQQMLAQGKYGTSPAPTAGASQWGQLAAALGLGSASGGLLQQLFGGGGGANGGGGGGGLLSSLFGGGGDTSGTTPTGSDPTSQGGGVLNAQEIADMMQQNGWGGGNTGGDMGGGQYGPTGDTSNWTQDQWMQWLQDNGMGGNPGSEGG